MLFKVNDLTGYELRCLDGNIGKASEFYFDDLHWTIRYLVVETGSWLTGRSVLISPLALGEIKFMESEISVNLTKKQVEDSPSPDSDRPVSRQFEEQFFTYYAWPGYWTGSCTWGAFPYLVREGVEWKDQPEEKRTWDPNLRSMNAVRGYHVHATDGPIGHVADFIIDEKTWSIRYLVVDTRNWWPGEQVVISPEWITDVVWSDRTITVNVSQAAIKAAPRYTPEVLIGREFETAVHEHYDRKGYWEEFSKPPVAML